MRLPPLPLRRCSALILALSTASAASAAPAKPAAVAPTKSDAASSAKELASADPNRIRAALDELRMAGPRAASAAPAIVDLLSHGLDVSLTEQAIDTLGDLGAPVASPILAQYATHRTAPIRVRALQALAKTKGPAAAPALRHALGDSDPNVRATAATGLGAVKAKEAVPELLLALDHRVNEAAASIGLLCTGEQCEKLAGKLGKLPFDVVTGGLDQILFRPSSDVSDDAKIKVIGRMRELGTAEVNRYLADVEKRLPKETSPRVRQAVAQAVKATSGGEQ